MIYLLAIAFLLFPSLVTAQKADGYAYNENNTFLPGIYEAEVDAKVYFDINKKAVAKGIIVKKGTQVSVYSAGYDAGEDPSTDWFNLSEGQECNGQILPWENFGWIGTLSEDFKRVRDLPKPIFKNGLITNCVTTSHIVTPDEPGSLILVIDAVPRARPYADVVSRAPVEMTGSIEFGHDVAGGNFRFNGGETKQYVLVYVWDVDEATKEVLGKLADAGTGVKVKGTLEVWKDGSIAFDNTAPIRIFNE